MEFIEENTRNEERMNKKKQRIQQNIAENEALPQKLGMTWDIKIEDKRT